MEPVYYPNQAKEGAGYEKAFFKGNYDEYDRYVFDQLCRTAGKNHGAGFVESIFLTKRAPVAVLDSDGDGVPDNKDRCPDTPKGVKVDVFGCPLDADRDGVPDYSDQCPDTPLGATIDARGCWTYASVVLFDFNSAEVKSEAYPMLNDAILILKKNPDLKVQIDGHTDNVGSAAYNMTLSLKRAEAIKEFFVSRGINPERLSTKGFGFTKPSASNNTEKGRVKNRRVEFTPVKNDLDDLRIPNT